MAVIRNTASEVAEFLAHELNIEQRDAETIRYGMEIIIGILIKGVVIISVAYWLGITPYVLVALATFGSFRILSGGVHCNTYSRCLAFTLALGVLIAKSSIVIDSYFNNNSLLLLIVLTTVTGLYSVKKWAPVDTPNKPINRKEKRDKFQKLSISYVFSWSAFMILFIYTRSDMQSTIPLALASIGGFLAQVLSLWPIGCRLTGKFDYMLSKFIP